MISKIWSKLRDRSYRSAFVASQIDMGIPFQIRGLLKSRGKTQQWLAEKTGMLQPRVSRLLTPGKSRPNIESLRRVAEAFDCGLAVRFVPFRELAQWHAAFQPEAFSVATFEQEDEWVRAEDRGAATRRGEAPVEKTGVPRGESAYRWRASGHSGNMVQNRSISLGEIGGKAIGRDMSEAHQVSRLYSCQEGMHGRQV